MKIYISSTTNDLRGLRNYVSDQIAIWQHQAIYMEDYSADAVPPLQKCLEDVRRCDIYLGIFAWRYGYIPPEHECSITELEFQEARQLAKPMAVFVLDENAPWPGNLCDKGEAGLRMERLREWLLKQDTYTAVLFHDEEDFRNKVPKAISDIVKRVETQIGKKENKIGTRLPTPKVTLDRLPTNTGEIFGREKEVSQLDDAWKSPETNVVCLVGDGGMGKSAVLNRWLGDVARDRYRGAAYVFGWSFYSQEEDQKEVSADAFINEAWKWFEQNPNDLPASTRERGRRLAEIISQQRSLLILDGLEAIQHRSGSEQGAVKDQAVQVLLKSLGAQNEGLCLVATRQTVSELRAFAGRTVHEIRVDFLSEESGITLLRDLGVRGSHDQLGEAVREYRGYPLALTLLGSYLMEVYEGNIEERDKLLPEDDSARHVMEAYERLLEGGPELELLRILGLFNRPAPSSAIRRLLAPPSIPGLTDKLGKLSEPQLRRVIASLKRHQLAISSTVSSPVDSPAVGNGAAEEALDTHAKIRQHFSKFFQFDQRDGWREANRRLYDYYRQLPTKQLPDTFEEMAPLFHAVAHGCRAGEFQRTWDEVAWARIRREDDGYSVLCLNAWQSDLAAMRHFFLDEYDVPAGELGPVAQAWLLTETAFDLRGLGRLSESIRLLRQGVPAHEATGDTWAAADAAGNLSETTMLYGDLEGAREAAERSLRLGETAVLAAWAAWLEKLQSCDQSAPAALERTTDAVATFVRAFREALPDGSLGEASPRLTSALGELPEHTGILDWLTKLTPAYESLIGRLRQSAVTLATNYCTLAEVLHKQNELEQSLRAFQRGESLYRCVQPSVSYIHGYRGFHFCDLLLTLRRNEEAKVRAAANAEVDRRRGRLYAVGLAHLAEARATAAETLTVAEASPFPSLEKIEQACRELRQSSNQESIVLGLLGEAELCRVHGIFDRAQLRIDEILAGVGESQMRLLEVDGWLKRPACVWQSGRRKRPASTVKRLVAAWSGCGIGAVAKSLTL